MLNKVVITFEPVDEIVQLYTVNNVTVALPILSAKVLFFFTPVDIGSSYQKWTDI